MQRNEEQVPALVGHGQPEAGDELMAGRGRECRSWLEMIKGKQWYETNLGPRCDMHPFSVCP